MFNRMLVSWPFRLDFTKPSKGIDVKLDEVIRKRIIDAMGECIIFFHIFHVLYISFFF